MYTFLIFVHVVICAGLILVVLMQSAKGDGLAGMFGGGAGLSGAVFGGRGAATFLSKATSILAAAFIVSSIALTLASRGAASVGVGTGESVIQRVVNEQQQQLPANTPATTTTQPQTTPQGTGDASQQPTTPPAGGDQGSGGEQQPAGEGTSGGGN